MYHVIIRLGHSFPVCSIIAYLESKLLSLLLDFDIGLVIVLGVDDSVSHSCVDGAPY